MVSLDEGESKVGGVRRPTSELGITLYLGQFASSNNGVKES